MQSAGSPHSVFHFSPSFERIEAFLRFYQIKLEQNEAITIHLDLPFEYEQALIGYPDLEQNCWLTLRYAVEQMNRSFYLGKSQVQVEISLSEGKK